MFFASSQALRQKFTKLHFYPYLSIKSLKVVVFLLLLLVTPVEAARAIACLVLRVHLIPALSRVENLLHELRRYQNSEKVYF